MADIDVESLLKSYESAEALFSSPSQNIDDSDIEIPINLPNDDASRTETFKSAPYALVEASSRTVKITHIDIAPHISNAGVRGMVTNVAHGTFHSRPATLLVLSFALRSGQHGFRFKNANFKITFAKHPLEPATQINPAIVKFAPRKIYGLPTVEGKKNRIGGEISLQVPAGPLTVGPTFSGEKESQYEKEHRFRTVGNYWSSKHSTDWDVAYWDVKENPKTKHGIPDRLNVAMVVEREGTFTASVCVEVDTPVANGIFAFPWSKNSPVAFAPSIKMGQQPRTDKFDELSDAEWRALIPYEEEWENKLTEEMLRSGAATPLSESASQAAASLQAGNLEVLPVVVGITPTEESDDR